MANYSSITRRDFVIRSASAAAALCAGLSGCQTEVRSRGQEAVGTTGAVGKTVSAGGTGVSVYSWSDAHQLGIVPMLWQPVSQIGSALMLVNPIPEAFDGDLVDIVANGPDLGNLQAWIRQYFLRFNLGIKRVVLDEEASGISYWQLCAGMPWDQERVDVFAPVWADQAAYANLPADLRQFEPADFAAPVGRGRNAVIAWEKFAAGMKADALWEVVYKPAVSVFGKTVAVSNYSDMEYDFPVFDVNGWPRANALMGNWSSPSCFLWNRGQRYQNQPKPIVWNNFIDSLNYVRSCLNVSRSVAPWVSYPSFHQGDAINLKQQQWLWGELIGHMKACGIVTFLYWNPHPGAPAGDDALAAKAFAASAGTIASGPYTEIALNADTVRTGGKVTRFTDWKKIAP
jgi:hypothetical protein